MAFKGGLQLTAPITSAPLQPPLFLFLDLVLVQLEDSLFLFEV